jgi:Ca2+-binding RTX toxin-like protein
MTASRLEEFMAPISKIGLEILVNTTTAGTQFFPQIATLSNGGFVVTWQDGFSGGIDDSSVKAQVFTAAGAKTGSEILVNTAAENGQFGQQITALANGGFVVTWTDFSQGVGGATGDDSSTAIKAQVFAPDGAKTGSEILVNTAVADSQFDQQITALSDGGFVVTWTDYSAGVGGATGDRSEGAIKAQVFTAAGAETGSEIRVNTATQFDQIFQQVTALENGGFVVTWEDYSKGGGASGDFDGAVKAQVFAADGTKTGSEILVNTAIASPQFSPQITALSDGGFVVTWADDSLGDGGATGDTNQTAIKAQVFAANGTKTGSEILVNTAVLDDQFNQQITALSDGGFVVTWVDDSRGVGGATGDSSRQAIKAQVFTAAGEKTGSEILVNTATRDSQLDPQITALENGDFVVAWWDFSGGAGGASGDYSPHAVKAQLFSAAGDRIGSEILVNTATADHQGRPQITALPGGGFVVTWEDASQGIGGTTGDNSELAVKAQIFGHNPDPNNTTPPTITTALNQGVAEDSTFVAALTSTDPDSSGINPAFFTITGGVDGSQFDIVDGNLLFKEAKDFETDPQVYRVKVTAFDGFNTSSRTITINITDVAGATIDGTAAADVIDATHAPPGEPFPTDDDDTIAGFARSDTIHGLGGGDWISGGGAADTLFGDEGNDRLNGGRGADFMHGGAGNDLYIVDHATDAVIENAGEGTDRVAAWSDFTLGDNVDNLILKGDGDLNGTGNALGNEIFGNDGNNILYGGTGTDTSAGTGSDLLFGGAGNDLFVFRTLSDSRVSSSRDVIRDFLIGADQIDLTAIDANSRLAGDQAFNFIGSGAFSRTAGELQAKAVGPNTLVQGDVNGNGRPDFQILVTGHVALQETDFLR